MLDASGEAIDTSYEPFSREPEYIELNRLFVEGLSLGAPEYILDLACGTGTLTELLLEKFHPGGDGAGQGKPVGVVGLDLTARSLQLAREHLARLGWTIFLAQASAEALPIADDSMDLVVVGNAIQLFNDKEKAVREVRRVLRRGGTFAFNTSFYAGTYAPGTERFYLRWVEEAVGYIARRNAELKRQGLPGIPRKKGLAKPAFSQPWLSREEYERLLEENGFEVGSVTERTVMLTQSSFEAIGSFAGLACVLLSGYPVGQACEALKESVGPALASVGAQAVPRYWIEFSATRR
jgi:ubiquinone/menaquinone biosynthesis C-methylase UbiE